MGGHLGYLKDGVYQIQIVQIVIFSRGGTALLLSGVNLLQIWLHQTTYGIPPLLKHLKSKDPEIGCEG